MLNERQIAIRVGGNFTTLKDFMDRRKVYKMPVLDAQEVAVSSAQFVLLNSGIVSGTIAKGTTTTNSGGYFMAALAGAIGSAATTTAADSLGNILNLVKIVDATSHDPVVDAGGNTIYGLAQCASSVTDGDAIGAALSENIQLSFVTITAAGAIALATVDQTIVFQLNKVIYERNIPTIYLDGGNLDKQIVEPTRPQVKMRKFTVTTGFIANEVLTLSTGAGATAGVSTASGDTVTLNTSAALFNADKLNRVRLNGVQLERGVEVIWDSTNSLHVNVAMDVNDVLEVEIPV